MTLVENPVKQFDVATSGKDKKKPPVHMPIVIEREEYEVAYVCEDINNDKNDSFLVLLTRFNGEGKYPYLLKFTKTADGKYWKIPQDKVCNTTVIQGLTWDFLKQNAMAENAEG